MSMHYCSPIGKIRTAVIICCLVLILAVFGYAYISDQDNVVLSKDKIFTKIDELSGEDLEFAYVSSYIKKYGVGNLNSYKFNEVENMLNDGFYKDLPEKNKLAEDTVRLFLENYYDSVDLDNKTEVTDALLKCMMASIADPYAYYRTADEFTQYNSDLEGGEEFIGIGVSIDSENFEIFAVFNDSGAEAAGIQNSDVIRFVNGISVEGYSIDDLVSMIKGEEGSTVEITVERAGKILNFTVERKAIVSKTVIYRMLDNQVGYIQITQFLQDTPSLFIEAVDYLEMHGATSLVIDVRNNPGGLLYAVEEVIDYLAPDKDDLMIDSYTTNSGKYICYTTDGHGVDLPIIVLCNKDTASAGELFTAAMRDFNDAGVLDAVVIGATTFGKGIVQSSYSLYDNSAITFTIGYYNPPCDINFHGVGIVPDIEISKTVGYDEQLSAGIDKALELSAINKGAAA